MAKKINRPNWFCNEDLKALQYGIKEKFKNHKATIITETENIFVMEWKNKNGSQEYFVKYILDKQQGVFMVYGDLGESMAYWHNELEVTDVTSFVYDIGYYSEKIKIGNIYTLRYDDIINDLSELRKEYIDNTEALQSFDKALECVKYDNNALYELLTEYIETDELSCVGKRLDQRIHLWAAGFLLACEQLGIIEIVD